MKILNIITGQKARLMAIALLVLSACSKDKEPQPDANSTNGITAIVNNNFSLSLFGYALNVTRYNDTLSKTGPFTVLCPSNTAFVTAGYASGTAVLQAAGVMGQLLPYCVLKKAIKLKDLPLAFNQSLVASNGQTIYITHWQNSRDTAVTANGIRISTVDKLAANGLLNIADGFLSPPVYKDVQEAVSGDASLSFFNAAIIHADLAGTLKSSTLYTVFAPVNSAFARININSVDDVYNTDPEVLKALVRAHIAAGRNFVYDYILKADVTSNTYQETMDNGMNAKITLIADPASPGRFTGISVLGTQTAAASLSKSNVLAGNGVVHSINSILTQ